ncbi:MAG: UTP--glucose-1-phosphate uridylyltransferase [Candidatus Solibacter sp.]|nr:UTP--glucose-1-phosphate uridylyltransferase [Candidatus Solibacter sp.]
MTIDKAVITAAGPSQRALPLQRLIDRDGQDRTVLAILVEEAAKAGMKQVAVVVHPGDESACASAAEGASVKLHFIPQAGGAGYARAIWSARDFTGSDPFLHLVGDHLYVGSEPGACAARLVEAATRERCSVSAVQATHESLLPNYGAVGGQPLTGHTDLYTVDSVIEKPTPTLAERSLVVPGLRTGQYLCFFGMHVLTPTLMDVLDSILAAGSTPPPSFSSALQALASRERYLALLMDARRYDLGVNYGLFMAQAALALNGRDRDEVLTRLVQLLAASPARKVSL